MVCAGSVLCFAGAGASADTVRVVKYASEYAWDEEPVRGVVGDSPTGWGGQCWQGPPTGKTNFYLTTADIQAAFGDPNLELGDIAKISFHTKRDSADASDKLFFLNLYTVPTGSDDSASWYKSRLLMDPDFGHGTDSREFDIWQLWSSDDGESATNQLKIADTGRNGFNEALLGDVGTWIINGRDYTSELFGLLAIGTNSGDNGNNTYVDGLTITLVNGDTGEFDMQVLVPLPSAAGMSLAGLGLIAVRRRR